MFASSKPCPGEVRNEMFVYSKKFSSNCDYWRGLLRHVSNVLNGEYNTWRWCLLVHTSFGKHNQITNGHFKVVSMLKCPQNLFLRGMMSSKDPKILLTVKIFADKQTKFRCQTFLTCLWVYWGNSQLQIVPLLSLISVIKSQSRVSVHCSAIKQHSLFIDNSLLLPPVRAGTLES